MLRHALLRCTLEKRLSFTTWTVPTSKYVGSISKYSSKYFAEATLIHDVDKAYSKGSRMATEMGGFVERLWGSLTKVYISIYAG